MSASVYPASLAQKGNGYRHQAWCHACSDGVNTKRRPEAAAWCTAHNETVDHTKPRDPNVPGPLYTPRPGRTYEPRPDLKDKDLR